uniref:DNA damage-regulated autophagy modulator protein 2 n=1 Tax=Globodera pallida TaxID=36090 RepID=A0A183CBA9_GLOPA
MRILQMKRLGAGHLPVFFAICFVTMLGCTYAVSVWRGDIDPVFPYISASGDARPESCIFSMMLSVCSFFSVLLIILRYSLVVELNRSSDLKLKAVNRLAFYVGISSGVGMFIVANFQETAVVQVHLFGAFLCFGSGCVYMLLQSWVTYRMSPLFNGPQIAHIRLAIALAGTISFATAFSFGLMAANTFHYYYPDRPTPRPWTRKHGLLPGYDLHCISAIAEWTLALLKMAFLLSYSREFEKIRVELGVQPLVSHLDQSPIWHYFPRELLELTPSRGRLSLEKWAPLARSDNPSNPPPLPFDPLGRPCHRSASSLLAAWRSLIV